MCPADGSYFDVANPVGEDFPNPDEDLRVKYNDPDAYYGSPPIDVNSLYPPGSTLEERIQMRKAAIAARPPYDPHNI